MVILHIFVAESDVRQERVLKDKNSIIQMKVIRILVSTSYCSTIE